MKKPFSKTSSKKDVIELLPSHSTFSNLELRKGPYMEGSWFWPKVDRLCWDFFNSHERRAWYKKQGKIIHFPDEIMNCYTGDKNLVIQAGGNCGLYAKIYSKYFKTVFSFEPDPSWFKCLSLNCSEENVIKFQLALGNDFNPIKTIVPTWKNEKNYGAIYVGDGGNIPKITIDAMKVKPDLIHLDVEGFESEIILGAKETISKHKPYIVIEWNKSGNKFGWTNEKIEKLFLDIGYKLHKEWERDRMYVSN